jgi:hypothetical protein
MEVVDGEVISGKKWDNDNGYLENRFIMTQVAHLSSFYRVDGTICQ